MKNVYICHQYYEPSHYKALYDCAENYGYRINDVIVLHPGSAVFYREQLIEQVGLKIADEWYQNNFINQGKLWLLRNQIVIIGVAPYDRLLAQYRGVLASNHSIYMTSCQEWDSGKVPHPYPNNREGFMETLTHYIDGVACVSRETERQISTWNSATQVVNHAIKVDEYVKKRTFKRNGKYIFLGRLADAKNIRVIIEYLEKFPEKKIEIDIVGDGPLRHSLEEYAVRDSRFRLLGYFSKNEIKECLHKYDYLILPSHQEPFGIVLLEALASGIPCIISNLSGPMEIISHGKTGIVFALEEEEGFARAMDYSMGLSDDAYRSMCIQAMSDSEQYDVEEIVKKWILLFEKVSRNAKDLIT